MRYLSTLRELTFYPEKGVPSLGSPKRGKTLGIFIYFDTAFTESNETNDYVLKILVEFSRIKDNDIPEVISLIGGT